MKTITKNLTTPELRKHAELIKAEALRRNDRETDQTLAKVAEILAICDLRDAESYITTPTVAETAELSRIYPILGTLITEGGLVKKVQSAWTKEHVEFAAKMGLMISFAWVSSLYSDDCGHCNYIYIGTKTDGPLAQWASFDRKWRAIKSRGNFGKNWACGGNWMPADFKNPKRTFNSLSKCNPHLDQMIKTIKLTIKKSKKMNDNQVTDATKEKRIAQAKAKLEAAKLRVFAAQQRAYATSALRQSQKPIYDGQAEVCINKASSWEAHAEKTEAAAELLLAEAGYNRSTQKPLLLLQRTFYINQNHKPKIEIMEPLNTIEPTITKHFSSEALHYLASLYDEYGCDETAYYETTGEKPEISYDLNDEESVDEMRSDLYHNFDAIRLENGNLLVPKNH